MQLNLCQLFKNKTWANTFYNAYRNYKKMTSEKFVWIDLELTGLDPSTEKILEIACVITNPDLEVLDSPISTVIYHEDKVLNSMNDWCKINHNNSGLTDEVRKSTISLAEAEKKIINYIEKNTGESCTRHLAGNSVYMDLLFLKKFMPHASGLLHYRLIDVSSIKTLVSLWHPDAFKTLPKKKSRHRAADDILESIEELKNYRSMFFK